MEFITVTSLGGSTWSFRKDRIEMVINRFTFTEEESKNIPGSEEFRFLCNYSIDR